MAKTQMHTGLWKGTRQLAAELAQRSIDPNLIRVAADFMEKHPDADLFDWLDRLVRLGDIFGSSNNTSRYRHEFQQACLRVSPRPETGMEWALLFAWAARLYRYYSEFSGEAQNISDVWNLRLPNPPRPWQPPAESAPDVEDNLPEVREEVSDDAKDLFAQFLAKSGKK